MGIDTGLGVGIGLVKGSGRAGPTGWSCGLAAATATAPAPARAGGGQLLAGFLQHQFGILAGANHPHHQVVATGAGIQQQGGVKTQPAVDELLIGLHRDGHKVRLLPAAGGVAGAASPTAHADATATAAIGGHFRGERWRSGGFEAGGVGEIGAATATAATATAAAGGIGWGHRTGHLGPRRGGRTHQSRGGGQG